MLFDLKRMPQMMQLFDRKPAIADFDEKRRGGRFECSALPCNLGAVMDLSRTGLKVRCSANADITVGTKKWLSVRNDSGEICVDTIVRRVERISKTEIELGLEFVKITDRARKALYNVSQNIPPIDQRGIEGC